MNKIPCPHCGKQIRLAPHSAFMTGDRQEKDYHEDESKKYRTSAAQRKACLAYYWKNRDRVLAREKAKRDRVKVLLTGGRRETK